MIDDQVKEVLDRVLTWPSAMQEEAAHVLLALEVNGRERYQPGEDEWVAVQEGLAQARRGEFAPAEEIADLLKSRGTTVWSLPIACETKFPERSN